MFEDDSPPSKRSLHSSLKRRGSKKRERKPKKKRSSKSELCVTSSPMKIETTATPSVQESVTSKVEDCVISTKNFSPVKAKEKAGAPWKPIAQESIPSKVKNRLNIIGTPVTSQPVCVVPSNETGSMKTCTHDRTLTASRRIGQGSLPTENFRSVASTFTSSSRSSTILVPATPAGSCHSNAATEVGWPHSPISSPELYSEVERAQLDSQSMTQNQMVVTTSHTTEKHDFCFAFPERHGWLEYKVLPPDSSSILPDLRNCGHGSVVYSPPYFGNSDDISCARNIPGLNMRLGGQSLHHLKPFRPVYCMLLAEYPAFYYATITFNK